MITLPAAAIILIVTGFLHILTGTWRLLYLSRANTLPLSLILIGAVLLHLGLTLLEKIR